MHTKIIKILNQFQSIPLLLIRLILAYGFLNPALMKVKDINSIAQWFESLGLPFPTMQAYMATFTELSGVILLFLGLFTRYISFPLVVVMIVAIKTVHLGHGFEAGNNGFEIPLYYIIMLITLIFFGAGKFSIDYLISKDKNNTIA